MERREAGTAKMGFSGTFYVLKMIEHESKNEKKTKKQLQSALKNIQDYILQNMSNE